MAFKPFKAPSLKSTLYEEPTQVVAHEDTHPAKRRKIVQSDCAPCPSPMPNSVGQTQAISERQPLHTISNTVTLGISGKPQDAEGPAEYFSVLWRKFTQKKNKTWDDDGYISIKVGQVTLFDNKGKCLSQGSLSKTADSGVTFSLGGRDIEIADRMSLKEFKIATGSNLPGSKQLLGSGQGMQKETAALSSANPAPKPKTLKEQMQMQIVKNKNVNNVLAAKHLPLSRRIPFKQPLKENTVLPQIPSEKPVPRHDPDTPGSLVFNRPKKAPLGQQIVDVVLDPLLSKRLREHQREGIKFLYDCVMGLKDFGGEGCILADDMGLGKTLQTIALLWTLIKQNPIHRAEPVVKKALIVCPVSLIQNWKKEFRKWLGRDRLGVLTLEDKGSRLGMFDGKNFKVLIVGYERLRNIAEDLSRGAGIDIVICDEGHRLKTLKNKSAKAIETLNTSKRVILSGTPIQNDLSEFFAMVNFVNDGCLGSYKSFVKDFENPIVKSRQPGATADDVEKGEDASQELAQTTSQFILRRTADILAKYLPPRTEYVLFCEPTPEQARIYKEVLKSQMFQSALGSHESALQLITILKKLCNSPALMRPERGNDESTPSSSLTTLNEMLPAGLSRLYHNSFSSKIRLLDELLHQIRSKTNDKVILVSNYTSTLNLMANLLDSSGGQYLRLDGSVPQGKRQGLVDEFNNTPASAYFAFLLSAKAGGIGLNLIGANRLVLFDVDWNPATDDQAMARIHREGQKKPCLIYRFLIKGGLEERIWQRQVVKRGLADSIMEGSAGTRKADVASKGKKGKAVFSKEELQDLFRLDESSGLRTHDLIGCECGGRGELSTSGFQTPVSVTEEGKVRDKIDSNRLLLPMILTKASCLTDEFLEQQERRLTAAQRTDDDHLTEKIEKHELKSYLHIDTSLSVDIDERRNTEDELVRIEAQLDDACLVEVLKQGKDTTSGRITYVFKKSAAPYVEALDDDDDDGDDEDGEEEASKADVDHP